jgi:excisionase family DNA binding protein
MDKQEQFLSLDEVCELLKVKRSYIYNLTSQNLIPFYRIGGLKFKLSEVQRWAESKKEKARLPRSVEDLL